MSSFNVGENDASSPMTEPATYISFESSVSLASSHVCAPAAHVISGSVAKSDRDNVHDPVAPRLIRELFSLHSHSTLTNMASLEHILVFKEPSEGEQVPSMLLSASLLRDWIKSWNNVVSKSGTDMFPSICQQWVNQHVSPCVTPVESALVFQNFHLAFREFFHLGVDFQLGELMRLRDSQFRTFAHYKQRGAVFNVDDKLRMVDAVKGYNAFRRVFLYPDACKEGGWRAVLNPLDIKYDVYTSKYVLEKFQRSYIISPGGLPRPHEVISATFGRKLFIPDLRVWECDMLVPNTRVLVDVLLDKSLLWKWHSHLVDTESYCEIACPASVLKTVWNLITMAHESSGFTFLDEESLSKPIDESAAEPLPPRYYYHKGKRPRKGDVMAIDHLVTVVLCCQWLADAINACVGKFYCDPVTARIIAAVEVCSEKYNCYDREDNDKCLVLHVDFCNAGVIPFQ